MADNNNVCRFVNVAEKPLILKKLFLIFLLFFLLFSVLKGQETVYGPTFQTLLMDNPGFSGVTGEGMLRLSYMNFFPGNNYGLQSFFASYDSFFDELHGGAGIWVADDYLGGLINDLRGGLSYAYSLRAGKEVYINAGLAASVFHRGFSSGGAVFPDMIDRLGGITQPSAESLADPGNTVLDINTGFLLTYRNFFAGISLDHLAQPDLSRGANPERLLRKLLFTASWNTGENRKLCLMPLGSVEVQGKRLLAAAGASAETEHIGVSLLFSGDNARNTAIQSGFAVNIGRLGIFYNYRFSVKAASGMMPFSQLHQTGLSIGLNPVDKRKIEGTIRMPRM